MRKQELLHLHALLLEVADYCNLDAGQFPTYSTQPVRPISIHRSKPDHREAVFHLTRDLLAEIDGEPVESIA